MSSTNKTTYYDLPQFVDNDIFNPLVDDNDAYSKIDTALHNIANGEADNASDIVGVKSRLDSAEGDIDALEAQNGDDALVTTSQTLSGAINELDSDINSLDSRLDITESDLNNPSTGLKAKVASLNTQMNSVTQDVTSLETVSGTWLYNKKCVAYGDSTVVGAGNYLELACNIANATLTNRARSATRMASGDNNGVSLITADNDLDEFDVIFLVYGTNEWQSSRDKGSLVEDTKTLINTVNGINPNIEIMFVLPQYCYRDFAHHKPNFNNRCNTIKDVTDIIYDVLRNEFNVAVINLYNRTIVNSSNYREFLEDSNGIYVHPLANLKAEIAHIILDGADSNKYYHPSTYSNILQTYDFALAQRYFTDTMVETDNKNSQGINMYISSGTTWKSGYKTLNKNCKYSLTGHTTEPLTIRFTCIDDNTKSATYTNFNGDFEMDFIPSINGTYRIDITTASSYATITNLALNVISQVCNEFASLYNGGRPILATLIDTTDISQTRNLKYFYGKNSINFMSAIFDVNNQIATGTTLFDIDDGFDMTDLYFIAYQATTVDGVIRKVPHILVINNNHIVNGEPLQTGTYSICQVSIPIPSDYRTGLVLS